MMANLLGVPGSRNIQMSDCDNGVSEYEIPENCGRGIEMKYHTMVLT